MSQDEQLDIFSEFAAPAADQQPQHSREGEIGERKEHPPMLPWPTSDRGRARVPFSGRSAIGCEAPRDLVFARVNQRTSATPRTSATRAPTRRANRHFETLQEH